MSPFCAFATIVLGAVGLCTLLVVFLIFRQESSATRRAEAAVTAVKRAIDEEAERREQCMGQVRQIVLDTNQKIDRIVRVVEPSVGP
jgi:hypothetical protein